MLCCGAMRERQLAELFPEVVALLRLCCHRSAGSRRRMASTAMTKFNDLTATSQRHSMPRRLQLLRQAQKCLTE